MYLMLIVVNLLHNSDDNDYDDNNDSNNNYYYLRQMNEVNGGDTVFVRCVSVCLSVCLCMCVCAQRTGHSDQFKTVKATHFKFDMYVPRDSPDMAY